MSARHESLSRVELATGTSTELVPLDQLERMRVHVLRLASTLAGVYIAVIVISVLQASRTGIVLRAPDYVDWGIAGLVAVIAGVVAWLVRSERIPLHRIVVFGLAFAVFGAFAIAFGESWGHASHLLATTRERSWLGISWVTVWITAVGTVMWGTRRQRLVTFVACAMMGPLVLATSALVEGARLDGAAWGTIAAIFWPNFAAALIAVVTSRDVDALRRQAQRARELGRYRLVRRLASGGMGEVWEAEHRLLARTVAIKTIRSEGLELGGDTAERAVRRFEREARATAQLRSPHTVDVYDFGVSRDGLFYYVMELLEGLSLDELVARHGPLPQARAVHLARQVLRSLDDAHAAGLVHRDVKPANVFAGCLGGTHDFVKVLDFGLVSVSETAGCDDTADAEELAVVSARLTAAHGVAGTPAFMPPEMVDREREADSRSDLYAFGCVLWWMLTGRLVFESPSPAQMMMAHHQRQPDAVRDHRPDVHPGLERLVLSLLAKDPDARPQSAGEVIEALDAVAEDLVDTWDEAAARAWWAEHEPECMGRRSRSRAHAILARPDGEPGDLTLDVVAGAFAEGAERATDTGRVATDATVPNLSGASATAEAETLDVEGEPDVELTPRRPVGRDR